MFPRSRSLIAALTALSLLAPLSHAQTRTGAIRGRVIDRDTKQPIAQATVAVDGAGKGAVTADDGRYVVRDVPVGAWRVRAFRLDYPPVLATDVVVDPARDTPLDFELAAEAVKTAEVEVRANAFAKPADQPTSSYQLSYEEIRRSPGAIGDVSRLVQSLPGVINTNDQRNDIVARGGSPAENLTIVDNVEVPNLNHFASQGTSGGPISMLNNEFVRDANFLAGGFPVAYGGRLSSVLDVRMRDGDRERFRSESDVTIAGVGQLFEGPLGRKGSWFASARQSYYDLVAEPFGITAVPHTTNWQLKAALEPGPRDRLWLVGIGGRDDIHFRVDADDLDDPSLQDIEAGGWRQITGLNWQHRFGTQGYGTLGVSDAVGQFDVDIRDQELGGRLVFRNRSTEDERTLKYDFAWRAPALADLRWGASIRLNAQDVAIDQPFGTQNIFSPDTARVNLLNFRSDESAYTYGAYAQLARRVGSALELSLGARADRFDILDEARIAPRAGLTLHATRSLDLTASVGRYYQQPALVFVQAYPVNRALDPMRADHAVVGLHYLPAPDLKLTVEAYQKDYADYPVSLEYPTFSLANTGDIYGVFGLLFPMTSRGEGRSRGIEFFAQKKLNGRFWGQLSYSHSRTEHAALDGVRRRGGYDAPHTGTVILGWKPSGRWEYSTRFSYASGRPFTPALEPQSTQQNRYILDLARVNGERAADYHRLDLRMDRRFSVGGSFVTLFLEAQNVYDRENTFQYLWNPKTRQLETQKQISFLPVFGMNVQF